MMLFMQGMLVGSTMAIAIYLGMVVIRLERIADALEERNQQTFNK